MDFRLPALTVAMAAGLVMAGCAGAERQPGTPLPIGRAVHEALEELPGAVLTGRHYSLSGGIEAAVAASDSATAAAAMARAFAVADSVDRLASLQAPNSEVARVNAAAGREAVSVSPWTETMVATALEWADRTNGAFDPTVGPVIALWGFSGEAVVVPTNDKLEEARRLVDWRKVQLDTRAHTVMLTEAGMILELRALAKGFALDRMREALMAAGATGGLIDFDGDLLFFGPGTESQADLWPIELPDPYDPTRPFARLELPSGGLSTSAYYDRIIEIDGERYGDIVDPRTGWPVRGLASVSVYAHNALVNDILSTALVVMGREEGRRFADALDNVESLFVVDAEPGEESPVFMSAGMGRYLKRLDPPHRPEQAEDE